MDIFDYILFSVSYWCWCLVFFLVVQKIAFYLANVGKSGLRPRFGDVCRVYRHGFVSDAIVASYFTAIPLIAGLVHTLCPAFSLQWIMVPYNVMVALAIGLISISDAALYGFWHSKIDASVFSYLRHPKGAFASVSAGYLIVGFSVAFVACAIFWIGAQWLSSVAADLSSEIPLQWWIYWVAPICFVLMGGSLFVIIRGLKIRPNNPSVVYYSPVAFFNHWALNPVYNMIYSFGTLNEYGGRFQSMDSDKAKRLVDDMFPTHGTPLTTILRTPRPNILVVVWESFGAEFCGVLGGRKDVSPCFDKLCEEGVLFTDCRASSFRTDRALPAIFCGLPGQPTASIIRHTRKLPALPAFPRRLRDIGYETVAVHGGDLTIMHKSDFYISSGHSRIVAQKDFPTALDSGKWGVHDLPVMEWVADEAMRLDAGGRPWLMSVQTLSSHEPFKVPYERLNDEIENSMAYTDEALGKLTGRLKATPVWDNLLMIVVADHGLNFNPESDDRAHYAHIPLLFVGGAVKKPMKINTPVSQTDIAATLLGQMGLPHDEFIFSRDVLADTYRNYSSFHTYVDGFLFSDSTGTTDYDNVRETAAPGTSDTEREMKGRAILQVLYAYIDKL